MADMVVTTARPGLTPLQWDSDFFTEYVRDNQFSRYMGTKMTDMIQVREDLTRKRGDTIVFATVRRLVGTGVTGNTILEGNEEQLNARSLNVVVAPFRHAVAVSDWDEQKSAIDLRMAARDMLLTWEKEKMRNDIIAAMGAVSVDGNVTLSYAAASAGQRNAWLTNNADRMQFGILVSNGSSNVFATALATVDNTADKMSAALLTLVKRRARTAVPHIRPIKVSGDGKDEEWYIVFVPSLVFRDLMLDATILQGLDYAWQRGASNPLFTGGDLLYDGMIIREVPELPILHTTDTGGSTVDCGFSYLCGAQAIGIGWSQRMKSTTNTRDYGYMHGVGIQEMRGIAKLRFGKDATTDQTAPVDQGVFTIVTAAQADS